MEVSRRTFVAGGAVTAAAAFVPANMLAVPTQAADTPNSDTTMKFFGDGRARPFAGNTVICHLPAQCRMRDVMAEFYRDLSTASFRSRLGLTTVDSYHITIFPGANDQGRKASGWPSYVPGNASIADCNAAVLDRMRQLQLHCELPFRVMVDVPATLAYPKACTLRMKAVDQGEEAKLRSVRDRLAEVYGFKLANHASYEFHVTMSYQMTPFTEAERQQYDAMRAHYVSRIAAAQPVLELGNPEYCVFPDMLRFEPQLLLRCV